MIADIKKSTHSATVELALYVEGRVVPLAQVGPKFVILREPEHFFGGPAEVEVIIDGSPSRRNVELQPQNADNLAILPIVAVG